MLGLCLPLAEYSSIQQCCHKCSQKAHINPHLAGRSNINMASSSGARRRICDAVEQLLAENTFSELKAWGDSNVAGATLQSLVLVRDTFMQPTLLSRFLRESPLGCYDHASSSSWPVSVAAVLSQQQQHHLRQEQQHYQRHPECSARDSFDDPGQPAPRH